MKNKINLKNKKILVTGGTGLVGRELVEILVKEGASVSSISLDANNFDKNWGVEYIQQDLRDFNNCIKACKNKDLVFHIAGIKGSPVLTKTKQYTFFTNFIQMNTNMIAAMYDSDMERGLYTSTVGTYGPAKIFYEEKMWDQNPSKNDWFAGWAKRMGEVQTDAYKEQYEKQKISVIKPVNIYGKFDNFDLRTSTLIPSLVRKVYEANQEVEIWGDGSAERDIVHARDVARAAIFASVNQIDYPLNIGLGRGVNIKNLIQTLIKISNKDLEIKYDLTKPKGDDARVANVDKLLSLGFNFETDLETGLKETYEWFKENHSHFGRYDAFLKQDYSNRN
jgi:GDP-L-fucose synthase